MRAALFGAAAATSLLLGFAGAATATPVRGSHVATARVVYNRSAAAKWALAHAQDPEDFDAACAWFASKALWAGGLPKSTAWNDNPKGHGFLPWNHRPGTPIATTVYPLQNYLLHTFSSSWYEITANFRTNAVPKAQPGDLLFYDWDGNGSLDHVAVIVDIASGQYPEVSEWGVDGVTVVGPIHGRSPYQKRGWTWSQIHHTWLQAIYPHVRAYLLHLN